MPGASGLSVGSGVGVGVGSGVGAAVAVGAAVLCAASLFGAAEHAVRLTVKTHASAAARIRFRMLM